MYKAIRSIRITDPQKQLLIDGKDGKTTDETEQVKIITDHFRNTFYDETTTPMKHVPPKEMVRPFTQEEIKNAIRSLRNNKSAGTDNICAELLKYSPEVIHSRITEIFNSLARSGEYPEELKEGILVPLPKPRKPQGPPANLRPIILLSVIRKILAICMIRRTSQKLSNNPDSITTLDLRCIPLVKHRQDCTLFTTFSRSRTIVVYWCAISWC